MASRWWSMRRGTAIQISDWPLWGFHVHASRFAMPENPHGDNRDGWRHRQTHESAGPEARGSQSRQSTYPPRRTAAGSMHVKPNTCFGRSPRTITQPTGGSAHAHQAGPEILPSSFATCAMGDRRPRLARTEKVEIAANEPIEELRLARRAPASRTQSEPGVERSELSKDVPPKSHIRPDRSTRLLRRQLDSFIAVPTLHDDRRADECVRSAPTMAAPHSPIVRPGPAGQIFEPAGDLQPLPRTRKPSWIELKVAIDEKQQVSY